MLGTRRGQDRWQWVAAGHFFRKEGQETQYVTKPAIKRPEKNVLEETRASTVEVRRHWCVRDTVRGQETAGMQFTVESGQGLSLMWPK